MDVLSTSLIFPAIEPSLVSKWQQETTLLNPLPRKTQSPVSGFWQAQKRLCGTAIQQTKQFECRKNFEKLLAGENLLRTQRKR